MSKTADRDGKVGGKKERKGEGARGGRRRVTLTEKMKSKAVTDKNCGKLQVVREEKTGKMILTGRAEQRRKQEDTQQARREEDNITEDSLKQIEKTGEETRILEGIQMQGRKIRADIRKEITQCKLILRKDIEEIKRERNVMRDEQQEEDWKKDMEIRMESMENREVGGRGNKELKAIRKVLETNERKDRRRNIIIQGAQLNEGNMKEKLNLGDKVEAAVKIRMGANNNEAVVVRLQSLEDKKLIMKTKMLRGTQIFIDDDLTKEERIIQQIVRERAKEERNKGNRVIVGYQKVEINGMWLR